MSEEQNRLENISNWYLQEQLDFDKKLIKYRYETIKSMIKGNIGLELGPAEGLMTKYLKNHFKELTVVEGSLTLLKNIPDYDNIIKIHSLFEFFSPTKLYDCIIIDHVLEHVDDPVNILTTIKQWLNKEGIIIIGVPNANSLHRLVAVKMKLLNAANQLNERDLQVGHRRVYSINTLKKDIEKSGLRIKNINGVFLKPISNKQIQESWSEELIEGFFQLGKDFPEICADLVVTVENDSF